MNTQTWRETGQFIQIQSHHLFVRDTGGEKPVLVILHGYPTFSYDYHAVLPILTQRFRVVVHDHLGFGLSDKPDDYSYSLFEQADYALLLWEKLGIREAHIFAHDYGTSVATEILARHNYGLLDFQIQGMSLCNGSMHIELSQLRPIQKLLLNQTIGPMVAKLTNYAVFKRNMRKLWGDPSLLTEAELQEMWIQLVHNDGRRVLPRLTQYIRERRQFWHRWIGALQQTDLPINILWATEDPVAVRQMAEVLHGEIPNNQLQYLEGLGHYPMIEAPERWSEALLKMIQE
ncbi:MAG: alpha/beta hydrolase [Bacteroidota bacterium]